MTVPEPEPLIAFVLKGYPRLSETFIAQEIRALEERGLRLVVVSLRHPTDPARHPVHEEIEAPVLYLPEYLHHEPGRVARAWRRVRRRPGYRAALAAWRRDVARDRTRNRVRRLGQALVLAAELPPGVVHLHAHFLHTPASVTRYASLVTGLPWSASAHARDIWTTPEWEKREKLAECEWCVTCTGVNHALLAALAPRPETVSLVYHGLDLARFGPPAPRPPGPDGSRARDPVRILSVGRAVEKKGYEDLLRALARLPGGLAWRFEHVGGGERLARLRALADRLGIGARCAWLGPRPQAEVLERYRAAHLFALACRVATDGDRDGLPNVLVEAQSQGLACLCTRLSAVPELIEEGENGLLVEPGDVDALAAALERLVREPGLRARLGAAGERRVREHFGFERGIDLLARRLAAATSAAPRGPRPEAARPSPAPRPAGT